MSEFDYTVFGLMLRANRSIPTLPLAPAHVTEPDVRVHLLENVRDRPWPVEDSAWQMASPPIYIWHAHTPAGTYLKLRYASDDGQAEFVLDPAGTELWAAWHGRATLVDVTTLMFGAIFGCLLRHRGLTCLHGAVLGIDGRAIVILGAKGAGKSTTAMSLMQRGASVIADDLAVLDQAASGFTVRAGLPRLRLGPDAAAFVGPYEQLEPLWSQRAQRPQKRALDTSRHSAPAQARTPLAAVFILEPRGCDMSIATPANTAAAAKLMAHRYTSFALDRAGHARDFQVIGSLVQHTPVREIHRPDTLECVPELADRILHEVGALPAPHSEHAIQPR